MNKICCVSIGGTSIPYGNVYNDSKNFGNKKLEYVVQKLRDEGYMADIHYFQNDSETHDIISNIEEYNIFVFFADILNHKKIYNLSKILKNINKSNVIILIGKIVEFDYKNIIESYESIDYCCLGDASDLVYKIVFNLDNGIEINDNCIAKKGDLSNKKRYFANNIDRIPCFDFYEKHDINFNEDKTYVLNLKNETCFAKCSFCWSNKGPVVYKKISSVINEIKLVTSKFKIRQFMFNDNDIFDIYNDFGKTYLFSFFNEIIKLNMNICFSCFSKTSSITYDKIDLLKLMKKAGVCCFFIGIDSGNSFDKKLYNKYASIEEDYNAIKILDELNLFYRVGFININPYSTLDNLKTNFHFLKTIKSINFYHYGNMKYMLLPYTDLAKKVYEDKLNISSSDDYKIYDYNFKNLEIVPFINFLDRLFNKINNSNFVPYIKLKRVYENAKAINPLEAKKYENIIKKYDVEEYNDIVKYFSIIYEEQDLEKASALEDDFINKLKTRAEKYDHLSNLKEIIINTNIKKGDN